VRIELSVIVADIAAAIKRIDSRRPQAANARTGALYQPGIGPHPETQAVSLIARELELVESLRYGRRITVDVPYPKRSRQKCDLCIGSGHEREWAIEVKMFRLMGDNGKANDNMIGHILSPYPNDRSALTDCAKLASGAIARRNAIVIYGFDYPGLAMDLGIDAFEQLASGTVNLGSREVAGYRDLIHPIHVAGRVFGWEVQRLTEMTDVRPSSP
jgi:hypothetical protein